MPYRRPSAIALLQQPFDIECGCNEGFPLSKAARQNWRGLLDGLGRLAQACLASKPLCQHYAVASQSSLHALEAYASARVARKLGQVHGALPASDARSCGTCGVASRAVSRFLKYVLSSR